MPPAHDVSPHAPPPAAPVSDIPDAAQGQPDASTDALWMDDVDLRQFDTDSMIRDDWEG